MTDIIHSVADLIDERDREGLEATLARVALELTHARALTFWRVLRRSTGVWLRRQVIVQQNAAPREPHEDDTPLAAAAEPLRLAYESRDLVRGQDSPGGLACFVLPAPDASGILALIEIEAADELDRERIAMLTGMLRVYRSHLAALDYGDVDELTRLANRRTFDEQFRRLTLAEARRNGAKRIDDAWDATAHLAVADIDFFKTINDRFGHPYGDEVLVLFAGLMRDSFRDTDRLFRFGGEEFVILISKCGLDHALAAFERFRAAVEAYKFPQVGRVTVSLGVTSLRLHDTGSAAFGRADQALYVAKHRGRNRVMLFEALTGAATPEARRAQPPEVELF